MSGSHRIQLLSLSHILIPENEQIRTNALVVQSKTLHLLKTFTHHNSWMRMLFTPKPTKPSVTFPLLTFSSLLRKQRHVSTKQEKTKLLTQALQTSINSH